MAKAKKPEGESAAAAGAQGINPFIASCSKLLLFEGFSATLV